MAWVKLDDRFARHRKVSLLSDGAFRLHVSAMCWSAEEELNGFIPHDELPLASTVKRPERYIVELVERDLWHEVDDGWEIHDFLKYNPSSAKSAEIREKRRAAGQRGGKASGQARRKQNASRLLESVKQNGEANANPLPVPQPPADLEDHQPTHVAGA